MAELPKFPHPIGNRGRGTRWWHQILNRKWKYGRFAHAQYKIRYITLIYGGMSEILASYRKSGSSNMMVTSDFRPEVEIWPFRAGAVKNTLYNAHLCRNRQNSPIQTGSRNMVDGSLQSVQHTYHTRILFLKNTYVFLRIVFYHTRILELWPFRWAKIRLLK